MAESALAILALGGNLGDPESAIRSAVAELDATDGIQVVKLSPMVESQALTEAGIDETKPNYLNAVVQVKTELKPKALLERVREIETKHGRVRLERWGSRTLDIDIITYGNEIRDSKKLTIPHPRAYERAFVLVPWSLIDSEAILPGHGKVSELAEPMREQVWVK